MEYILDTIVVENWCPGLGYYWRDGSYGSVPVDAVRAGRDKDGSTIFLGRSFYNGDFLPAKVIPSRASAFVCWGGQEVAVEQYEVICSSQVAWEFATNGEVPEGAIAIGSTQDGEKLYAGRVMHDGTQTPGKVQPSHESCYIPYCGEEIAFKDTGASSMNHLSPSPECLSCLVIAVLSVSINSARHKEETNITLRANVLGSIPGASRFSVNKVFSACADKWPHRPQQSCLDEILFRAPTEAGELLSIQGKRDDMWVQSSMGQIPDGAVWAGKDGDGSDIFVGRAFHEGDFVPGKVIPSAGGAFIAYGGEEHSKFDYEVYCHGHVAWEQSGHGHVPFGAVEGGRTSEGEPLFVGRVLHNGTLTPGKVQPSHHVCYISYGGQEIPYDTYEVLIHK
uniref:Uncharacterized protein n=2 Tax=Timema TaxID=61471 RepID=A0A7R9PNQ9_TIMGE|nr:unnamed protein product [Timema genevievae]